MLKIDKFQCKPFSFGLYLVMWFVYNPHTSTLLKQIKQNNEKTEIYSNSMQWTLNIHFNSGNRFFFHFFFFRTYFANGKTVFTYRIRSNKLKNFILLSSTDLLNNMQPSEQNGQEKNRQNRNSTQTTAKGLYSKTSPSDPKIRNLICIFSSISKGMEPMNPPNCNPTTNVSTPTASSPNRMIVQSPSHGALHTMAQPYLGDSSNFGPFYHHHSHHLPSYGNPYDKYKPTTNMHHARSPNASPYDPYQAFYTPTSHHHQIVRPNGYIDLVPR